MNKNICSSCGTENEPEYKYCKNCGNEIIEAQTPPETEFKAEPQAKPVNQQQTYSKTPNGFILDNISGVPTEEVALFVGKKAYKLLPKFSKMEFTGSKISWCWPVAVLGYLFGPLGAAIWFFYRKMYKPALLLSLIGAVLTIITTVLSGGSGMDFGAAYDAMLNGDMNAYLDALEGSVNRSDILVNISSLLSTATDWATCILCGLFSYYLYRNHCIQKINDYKAVQADNRYYKIGLASIGGVSGGMAVLGIVIMILAGNLAEIITTLVSSLL